MGPEKQIKKIAVKKIEADLFDDLNGKSLKNDITSNILISKKTKITAHLKVREEIVLCGIHFVQNFIFERFPELKLKLFYKDGQIVGKSSAILEISGECKKVFMLERSVINFLQHLSSISTYTSRFVLLLKKSHTKLLNTRKTITGLRKLQKYATTVGGAKNHRMGLHDESAVGALATMTWRNKRRYGGYIVHIGVVLIFAGIAGSQAYGTHTEKHLQIGESFEIRGYTITYEKLIAVEATNIKTRIIAQLAVERNGKRYWTGHPEKEFYKGQNQPVSEVDVLSTWKEDLYMILADFREDESATIKVYHNPMVKWLWTGGWVIALGTMVTAWPDRLEQRRRLERLKKQRIVFAPAQE